MGSCLPIRQLSHRDRPKSPNYPPASAPAVSQNVPRSGKEPKILERSGNPGAPGALFTQNKPNPQNHKTTTTFCGTKAYEGNHPRPTQKNKPNQTQYSTRYALHAPRYLQNKPNSQSPKTTATSYAPKSYTNTPPRPTRKNKPNQTQSRKNKPNQTQSDIRNTRYAIRLPRCGHPTSDIPHTNLLFYLPISRQAPCGGRICPFSSHLLSAVGARKGRYVQKNAGISEQTLPNRGKYSIIEIMTMTVYRRIGSIH